MNALPFAPTPFAWRDEAEIPPRGFTAPLDALDGDVPPSGPTPTPAADARWKLPLIDTRAWIDRKPPERRWIIPQWLARGSGGLLIGEDGVGKSLLAQQLVTCVSWGKPFLGLEVEHCNALYLTYEDDEDELWRRQEAINAAVGAPAMSAPKLSSLKGVLDAQLGHFDEHGRFVPSVVFDGIAEAIRSSGTGLAVIDNLAHTFPGNENSRSDVAAFCMALDRLAMDTDAAILMLGHPNKSGAEYSGSTGWSAHVRQRLYLTRPEGSVDGDARILRKSKANYASSGDEVPFRWHRWAFVRDADLPADQAAEIAANVAASHDNAVFLTCLDERNRQERAVSENKASRTYAPKEFADMAESKRIGRARLEAAMDRLFRVRAIERGFLWRDGGEGKDKFGLRRVSADVSGKPADLPADLPLTPPADVPMTTRRRPLSHTPSTTYYSGGAADGPPPTIDDDDIDWGSDEVVP